MPDVQWDETPDLRRPIMIAAFAGWNDAAESATGSVEWLVQRWDARRIARVDPEEYYDFTAVRPQVALVDGVTRELRWPANECFAAQVEPGRRDAVLVRGVEPSLRWRHFCDEILSVAHRTGCEMVVTLGALLADVPHSRPLRITGTAHDDEMAKRVGLERSRYEGPTGIVGVLHDCCRRAGIPSVSLWAPVPHYVAAPPNPKATLALLDAVGRLLGVPTDAGELRAATAVWEKRVDEAVADDEDTATYVRELERRVEEEDELASASGDELVSQIEAFLREETDGGPSQEPD